MIKAIPVSQLRVGMFVSERNADWIPTTNKTKSGLILRQEIVDKIKARGIEYITIDTAKGVDVDEADGTTALTDEVQASEQTKSEKTGTDSSSARAVRCGDAIGVT